MPAWPRVIACRHKDTPVTIYIHDHCEFLIGPHSSVIIQPHQVSVTSGAVRAKHFGDCKSVTGGLWVTSPAPNGDAVVALSREHMEVGSVSGPVQIANEIKVVGMVQPGTVSAFNFEFRGCGERRFGQLLQHPRKSSLCWG